MKTYSLLANKIVFSSTLRRTEDDLHKYYVRKEADAIEELCDEFVMLRLKDELLNDNEPIIFKYLDLAKSYFKKYLGYAIYGAIWTKKGLIYVAKMNKEGKLCLL